MKIDWSTVANIVVALVILLVLKQVVIDKVLAKLPSFDFDETFDRN